MEELYEELKHHELEMVYFTAENYKVIFLGGLAIESGDCGHLLLALRAIRTASNHDARADDSEGGCRE